MILYVNSCVRKDSRTDRIARALLNKLGSYTELKLENENLLPLTGERLEKRAALIDKGDYSDPMFDYAKQFVAADTIVISAPYWELTFPALLKIYIENISIMGIASAYTEDGRPKGLAKAKKLYFVTTAGGKLFTEFGYGQIDALAKGYFGIPETELISAQFLDIIGNDPEKIVDDVISTL